MDRCTRTSAIVIAALLLACPKDEDDTPEYNGPAGDSPLDEPGGCFAACIVATDCGDAIPEPIRSECRTRFLSYPWNFECNGGMCEPGGCASDEECAALSPGSVCHAIDGIGRCVSACEDDGDCPNSLFCRQLPDGFPACSFGCASDDDCPEQAHCSEGDCVLDPCTSDADCEFLTYGGACENGSCRCRTNADCSEFGACAPL